MNNTKVIVGGVVASAVTGAVFTFAGAAPTIGKAAIGIVGPYAAAVSKSAVGSMVQGSVTAGIQKAIDRK